MDGGAPGREHAGDSRWLFLFLGAGSGWIVRGTGSFLWEEMDVRKGVTIVNHFGSLASA